MMSIRTIQLAVVVGCLGVGRARGQTTPTAAEPDRVAIRALLVAHQFPQLEALYTSAASSMRANIANEDRLIEVVYGFDIPDPSLRQHLDAWVTQRPSVAAYVARAAHADAMGWHARGDDWADSTKAEQFKGMDAWFSRASDDVHEAVRRDSTAVAAYWVLQSIFHAAGDDETNRRIVDRALQFAPASAETRVRYIHTLEPRWGGSLEQMRAFAEVSQRYADANPRLRALQGFAAWDEGRTLSDSNDDAGAVRKFTEALSYGDYREFFRVYRGFAVLSTNREGEAIRDFTAALTRRPLYVRALAGRALAYGYAARRVTGTQREQFMARARADIQRAQRIDRYDSDVIWVLNKLSEIDGTADP
jgi:hypothetical protein